MNKFEFKNLTPFKWFVLENFPFIEADFDALTEWQLFCKLGKEMNKIINSENTLGTQLENVTNAFIELQKYVNNYFDNLDVQEEINNKLNQMVEDGTLQEIVTSYLQIKGVLGFNNINDLKNSTNLIDGTIAKTLGYNTINDEKGSFYKIRNILNTDIVDEINIIRLINYNNLIAEKIKEVSFKNLENLENNIKTNTNNIQNISNLINFKKSIIIGDSYAYAQDNWVTPLIEKLGFTNNDYYKSAMEGAGFVQHGINTKFLTLLQNVVNNLALEEKEKITSVIVCGGANDNGQTSTDIQNEITTFVNYVNNNLPNAKTYIGAIGWTTDNTNSDKYARMVYSYKSCKKLNNCFYLNNVENTLHNINFIKSDKVHPTQEGCENLATNIFDALIQGSCNVYYPCKSHTFKNVSVYEILENNKTSIFTRKTILNSNINIESINCSGENTIIFSDQLFDYAVGGGYSQKDSIIIPCYFRSNGQSIKVDCVLSVVNRFICLFPFEFDPVSGYKTITNITGIYVPPFCYTIDETKFTDSTE